MANTRENAFTLVELLVVISIIAILLAVLLPSLGKARALSKSVVCMSNLKQITMAYTLYQNDYGSLPEYSDSAYVNGDIHWAGALRKYYSDVEKVRLCPAANKRNSADQTYVSTDGNSTLGDTFYGWYFDTSSQVGFELGTGETSGLGSYGENSWIRKPGKMANLDELNTWQENAWGSTNGTNGVSSNVIPLIFDSRWITLGPLDSDPIPAQSRATSLFPYCIGANAMYRVQSAGMRRHKNGINMFFLDWSGRNVDVEDLWNLKWNRTFTCKGRQTMYWVKQ